ncbi:MAG: TetR/AcrR family transcriptional regulator [Pseudomonadota bacterium]
MAGKKGFVTDGAVAALMHVFWEKGYEGASIADLEAATGLKRGSLYNAFGGKEAMFAIAFSRYAQQVEEANLSQLDTVPLAEGLAAYLRFLIEGAGEDHPPGCLISRSAAELASKDGDLGALVRDRLKTTATALQRRFERAAAAGELPEGADPALLAQTLAAGTRGLSLMAGAGQPQAAWALATSLKRLVLG